MPLGGRTMSDMSGISTSSSSAWARAARTRRALAEAGLAVAGVESRLVGGECPYWGCVPSKMMIRAARPAGRGPPDPRHGRARPVIAPDWAPVAAPDPGRGHRRLGRQGRGGPVHRQGRRRCSAATAASPRPARSRCRRRRVLRARRGHRAQPRHRAGDAADRRAWPGRRTGPTARPSRPSRCRQSLMVLGGGADRRASWPRCSPGSAPRSPSSRRAAGCCRWRSRRPASCSPRCSSREGITVHTGAPAQRGRPRRRPASPSRWPAART